MPNNLSALANKDGSAIDMKITQADGKSAMMPVPVNEAGFVAVGVLAGAVDCARKSGKFTQLAPKIDPSKIQHKYIKFAHSVAISETSDDPKLVVLIFAIGGTELGVGIPRGLLPELGASFSTYKPSKQSN